MLLVADWIKSLDLAKLEEVSSWKTLVESEEADFFVSDAFRDGLAGSGLDAWRWCGEGCWQLGAELLRDCVCFLCRRFCGLRGSGGSDIVVIVVQIDLIRVRLLRRRGGWRCNGSRLCFSLCQ